jgi:hypothetical protein
MVELFFPPMTWFCWLSITPPPGASAEGVGQDRRRRDSRINKLEEKIIYIYCISVN